MSIKDQWISYILAKTYQTYLLTCLQPEKLSKNCGAFFSGHPVDLRKCLIPDPEERARPLTYHQRTQHTLPPQNNLLQYSIHDSENFASQNKMVINKSKTKVVSFNISRKWDFPPELSLFPTAYPFQPTWSQWSCMVTYGHV